MTETILDKIVAEKKEVVAMMKRDLPVERLKERAAQHRTLDFAAAIGGSTLKLIAEIKKASPSKGVLCPDYKPAELAGDYARAGAAAISVLTEAKHFMGRLQDITTVREEVSLPILRKDFIIDEYQLYESAAWGADAILLIAAILGRRQINEYMFISRRLGLRCLVEVHNESEVAQALHTGAQIIGINNRDLATFKTDIETTGRLRPLIPAGPIVVSESGITTKDDIKKIRDWGVNAVLIGEVLVTATDPAAKIEELFL
jgi:indole-3-glycerol phosphate synthase